MPSIPPRLCCRWFHKPVCREGVHSGNAASPLSSCQLTLTNSNCRFASALDHIRKALACGYVRERLGAVCRLALWRAFVTQNGTGLLVRNNSGISIVRRRIVKSSIANPHSHSYSDRDSDAFGTNPRDFVFTERSDQYALHGKAGGGRRYWPVPLEHSGRYVAQWFRSESRSGNAVWKHRDSGHIELYGACDGFLRAGCQR